VSKSGEPTGQASGAPVGCCGGTGELPRYRWREGDDVTLRTRPRESQSNVGYRRVHNMLRRKQENGTPPLPPPLRVRVKL